MNHGLECKLDKLCKASYDGFLMVGKFRDLNQFSGHPYLSTGLGGVKPGRSTSLEPHRLAFDLAFPLIS